MVIRGAWVFPKQLDYQVLSKGLEALLQEYPLLLGKMLPDRKGITYPFFATVSFVEAEDKKHTLKELQDDADFTSGQRLRSLVNTRAFRLFQLGKAAPFYAQLTHFSDGSLLTVQLAHVLMDGHAFYRMMARWGALCRGVDTSAGALLDQALAPAPSGASKAQTLEKVQQNGWVHVGGKMLIRMALGMMGGASQKYVKTWHVSGADLARMKQEAGPGVGTNAVLSAYLVKRVSEEIGSRADFTLVFVIDIRERWKSLPNDFVGNATGNLILGGLRGADSLPQLAVKIQSFMDASLAQPQQLESIVSLTLDAMSHKLPYMYFDVADVFRKKPHTLTVNNLLRFHPYDIDFGYGRPVLVPPNDLPDRVKFWPSASGDGSVDIILRGFPA